MRRHGRPLSAADARFPIRFGSHLRALRLARGLTQKDLVGASLMRAAIAKLETGSRWPPLDAIEHLARVLGVSARALIPAGF